MGFHLVIITQSAPIVVEWSEKFPKEDIGEFLGKRKGKSVSGKGIGREPNRHKKCYRNVKQLHKDVRMNLGVMRDNPGELAETRTCKTSVPYQTFGLYPVNSEELQIFVAGV